MSKLFFAAAVALLIIAAAAAAASLASSSSSDLVLPADLQLLLRIAPTLQGGPNFIDANGCFVGWNSSFNFCNTGTDPDGARFRVACDAHSRVVQLALDNCMLRGAIPIELSQLQFLTYLDLHANFLSGTLPPSWGNMTQMVTLFLNVNRLSGPLPESWGGMASLALLDLNINQLTGALPPAWGNMTKLATLVLYDNQLVGVLPESWHNMQSLSLLALRNNRLVGALPESWGRLARMSQIDLSDNQLTGTLPASWGNMTQMTVLLLNSNRLSGPLPPSWGSMERMTRLALSNNTLTGTLPPSWGNMTQMTVLFLNDNRLSGPLPESWGGMARLTGLSLYNNQLTGAVPESWSSGMASVQVLDMHNNLLGPAVPSLSSMQMLYSLDLSGNRLAGALPESWAGLYVMFISLRNNLLLNATVPRSWSASRVWNGTLLTLDLSGNCIHTSDEQLTNFTTFRHLSSLDLTPSCVELLPIAPLNGAAMSGPYLYRNLNSWRGNAAACAHLPFGCATTTPGVVVITVGDRVFQLAFSCDLRLRFISSCVSALVSPKLLCFVDAAMTRPCPPSVVVLPSWHNVTRLATTLTGFETFDCAMTSVHGAVYVVQFDVGFNLITPLTTTKPPTHFVNVSATSSSFRADKCAQRGSAAINMTTTCTTCPLAENCAAPNISDCSLSCDGTTAIRVGVKPAWRPSSLLLPMYICPSQTTLGCYATEDAAQGNGSAGFGDETEMTLDSGDSDEQDESQLLDGTHCKPTYTGVLCARCIHGYGMTTTVSGQKTCKACASRGSQIATFSAIVVVMIVLVTLFTHLQLNEHHARSKKHDDGGTTTEHDDSDGSKNDACCRCAACCPCLLAQHRPKLQRLAFTVRALLNHSSLLGALSEAGGGAVVSRAVSGTLSLFKALNSLAFGATASAVQCLLPQEWSTSVLYFNLVWIVGGIVVVFCTLLFGVAYRSADAAVAVPLLLAFFAFSPLAEQSAKLVALCDEFTWYRAEDYLAGRKSGETAVVSKRLLSGDLAQECTPEFNATYVLAAWASIWILALVLPLLVVLLYKRLSSTPRRRDALLGFLTRRYKPTRWFWELIVMQRKMLVALIFAVLPGHSALQLQLYTIVVSCKLVLSTWLSPWAPPAPELRDTNSEHEDGVSMNMNYAERLSLFSAILCAGFISFVAAFPDAVVFKTLAAVAVITTQVVACLVIIAPELAVLVARCFHRALCPTPHARTAADLLTSPSVLSATHERPLLDRGGGGDDDEDNDAPSECATVQLAVEAENARLRRELMERDESVKRVRDELQAAEMRHAAAVLRLMQESEAGAAALHTAERERRAESERHMAVEQRQQQRLDELLAQIKQLSPDVAATMDGVAEHAET